MPARPVIVSGLATLATTGAESASSTVLPSASVSCRPMFDVMLTPARALMVVGLIPSRVALPAEIAKLDEVPEPVRPVAVAVKV